MSRVISNKWHSMVLFVSACCAVSVVIGLSTDSYGSIRLDGSQFQLSSLNTSIGVTKNKDGTTSQVQKGAVIFTFGQAVMALGSLPDNDDGSTAFKIGVGYEYNVLIHSYDNVCDCSCHGDPVCDGSFDVFDVLRVVAVAYQNFPPTIDANCPIERTDVDCSGATDMMDVLKVIDAAFRQGAPTTLICDPCEL